MKLTNNALQELYDSLVNATITMTAYTDSPIDKAFRECDEKLSESATFAHIKKLEKDLDDVKKNVEYFRHSRDDWRSRSKHAEDEVKDLKETLGKANADRIELQKDRDSYHGLYTELRKDCDKLFEENRKLKARDDCHRYEVEWYKWYRKKYKEQSDKIKELKKKLEYLTSQNQKLTIENKRLQNNVRAGYDQGQTDLWVKLQNVNNSQPFEIATCFPDVTGMEDILSWDLEDFLDAYNKWQEEKEKERLDHMRDYLARFCEGRLCEKCPLGSDEFKCGCGYYFKKSADWDMKIIPDEELERYYEKARGGGQCTLKDGKLFIHDISHTMESVNRGITKACEDFCKAVRDADIKIKERAWHGDATAEKIKFEPWSCTLEATVEVDKDLLNKVCGVKSDEEEHKLEYGDAVRVPWRDYDYMYIGPDKRGDGKMIRLFDPKDHSVSYVSSNENLDIRGYKIIIGNEEDLWKIWCDKK